VFRILFSFPFFIKIKFKEIYILYFEQVQN